MFIFLCVICGEHFWSHNRILYAAICSHLQLFAAICNAVLPGQGRKIQKNINKLKTIKPKGGGAKRRPLWGATEGGALLFFNLFAAFGHFCWPQPVSDLTSNKKPSWTQNKKPSWSFFFIRGCHYLIARQ